mmetsp:Transcript_3052/g.9552  ORF Transcript_3052/g.9552 Transcript_3052/m.9552 type:complete len:201 (-) Transcript_3052:604-1206(-)
MLSSIFRIFSKLTLRPRSARATRSRRASRRAPPCLRRPGRRARSACCFTSLLVTAVCSSEGLGMVFLKMSRESSEFRIFMVSPKAKSSLARALCTSSHSFSLVPQFLPRFARNALSSSKDAVVSFRSSRRPSISTPSCPLRCSLSSMARWAAAISFFLAFCRSSLVCLADSSFSVISARVFSMVSFICFMMPTISPLPGA